MIRDAPYPGVLTLHVDATDLDRRLLRARETIPVVPGQLTLYYPQWLPGQHGPRGAIDAFAGLIITANGRRIAWVRDPADVYAFLKIRRCNSHVSSVNWLRAQGSWGCPKSGDVSIPRTRPPSRTLRRDKFFA